MKILKLTIAAALMACTFQAANAQISVGLRIGTPPPRHVVVVREQPVYQEEYAEPEYPVYHREYYERPVVYNRVMVAPPRRVYYRHGYGRPVYHQSYYRHTRYVRHY
ncbi:hypothetical protein [Mucilaginibacter sp. UYCu711]|uniref:hypothetical protein n=1 Tax=Mucilaginibacter sp. UYCu711 TaxID=3156339 RepID=UPI003D2154F2